MNRSINYRALRVGIALLAGALAQTVSAQTYFGLQHTPIGNAQLDMTPEGLSITDLGVTGKDGFEIILVPPGSVTRMGWDMHVRGLRQPALDTSLRLACVGTSSPGAPEEACSMLVTHSGGVPSVSFDFSPIQPGSVRAVYYSHGSVILEEILPAPVGGPFPLSGTPVAVDPLYNNGFSAHFDFPSHSWIFDWTWDTSRMTTLGGGDLLGCDHVEVYAELPAVEFTSFDGVRALFDGVAGVTVTTETTESVEEDCPCDLAAPFGSLDFSDIVEFLQCFSGSCAL